MTNEYTKSWQDRFLRSSSPEGVRQALTEKQVQFLRVQLPLPPFRRVLDVCCGLGRHIGPLAAAGYDMVGVDRDPELIAEAQARFPTSEFICMDMRHLHTLQTKFDAVICMWQSFGYFDEVTNREVFAKMAELVIPSGRIVLDIYNRKYFQAVRSNTGGQAWTAGKWDYSDLTRYQDGRLVVQIQFATGDVDTFDWQLYSPQEMKALGESVGLRELITCAELNPEQVAGNRRRGFQIVFEKP